MCGVRVYKTRVFGTMARVKLCAAPAAADRLLGASDVTPGFLRERLADRPKGRRSAEKKKRSGQAVGVRRDRRTGRRRRESEP